MDWPGVQDEPHIHIRVDAPSYKNELFIPLRMCKPEDMHLFYRELQRMLDLAVTKEVTPVAR